MSRNQLIILFVGLFFCFAIGILLLYFIVHHYKQTKTLVLNGLMDQEIIREHKSIHNKKNEILSKIGNVFSVIFTIFFTICLGIGVYAKMSGNLFAVGNETVLVVASNSMSYKFQLNKYLDENNLNDQFEAFDLIFVHEIPEEKDIKKYDVVIYRYENSLIVHRVVDIKTTTVDGVEKIRFVTQGDANPTQDPFELSYDELVGLYSSQENHIEGKYVPFVGYVIFFFQSPLGLLALIILLAYAIFMPVFEGKLDKIKISRLIQIGYLDEYGNVIDPNMKGEKFTPQILEQKSIVQNLDKVFIRNLLLFSSIYFLIELFLLITVLK